MDDSRDIFVAAIFMFVGASFFFWGFQRFRRKRMIENIPTSTVRGLAMGLVELHGKTKPETLLKSPFTGTDCVLYMYQILEYRKSGKSSSWVTIASGDSFFSPFIIDDGTGRALVFPKNAEIIMPADYEFTTGAMGRKALPDTLINFMNEKGMTYKSWLGAKPLRFKEWYLKEDDPIYVLGTAKSAEEREALEKNPEKQDINAIITKGDEEKIFMISDHSEKALTGILAWQSFFGVFGGAGLSLAMLAYLLYRCRMLGVIKI